MLADRLDQIGVSKMRLIRARELIQLLSIFTFFQMSVNNQENPGPEPLPDLNGDAANTLGWLWPGHVYLFAVLFVVLTIVTISAMILKRNSIQNKHFVKTVMLCAVVLLSVSRSVILLVDPYLSSGKTSKWWIFGCVLITGLGTASLTTSLSILLYITTMSVRITSKYRQFDLACVVSSMTIANFVFFITSDVVSVKWKDEGRVMLAVCQITFAVWGILVSIGFGTLTYKLRKNARATFEQARFNVTIRSEEEKLRKLSIFLGIVAITSAMFFALRISEAISGQTSDKYADAWPWWTVQTFLRTLEIVNAVVLLLVFQRVKRGVRRRTNNGSESEAHTIWKNMSVKSTTETI